MTKRLFFFATPADIKGVLREVENENLLNFAPMGAKSERPLTAFSRLSNIDGIGIADFDQTVACKAYLVSYRSDDFCYIELKDEFGKRKFSISQLENPNSILFRPCGVYRQNICINGEISTVHNSEKSKELMKLFQKSIKRHFVKIKAFWVGKEAMQMLNEGKRLTMAVQSPEEFDLSMT